MGILAVTTHSFSPHSFAALAACQIILTISTLIVDAFLIRPQIVSGIISTAQSPYRIKAFLFCLHLLALGLTTVASSLLLFKYLPSLSDRIVLTSFLLITIEMQALSACAFARIERGLRHHVLAKGESIGFILGQVVIGTGGAIAFDSPLLMPIGFILQFFILYAYALIDQHRNPILSPESEVRLNHAIINLRHCLTHFGSRLMGTVIIVLDDLLGLYLLSSFAAGALSRVNFLSVAFMSNLGTAIARPLLAASINDRKFYLLQQSLQRTITSIACLGGGLSAGMIALAPIICGTLINQHDTTYMCIFVLTAAALPMRLFLRVCVEVTARFPYGAWSLLSMGVVMILAGLSCAMFDSLRSPLGISAVVFTALSICALAWGCLLASHGTRQSRQESTKVLILGLWAMGCLFLQGASTIAILATQGIDPRVDAAILLCGAFCGSLILLLMLRLKEGGRRIMVIGPVVQNLSRRFLCLTLPTTRA